MSTTAAAVPTTTNHQGRLFDSTGAPLDGTADLVFTLYDAAAGTTSVWTETFLNQPVDNGYFSVTLTGLDDTVLDGNTYHLGIQIDGGVELPTRVPLTSAPYAVRAGVADSVAGGSSVNADSISVNGTEIISSTGTIDASYIANVPAAWTSADSFAALGCSTSGELAMVVSGSWACVAESDLNIDGGQVTGSLQVSALGVGAAPGADGITLPASGSLAIGSESLDEAKIGLVNALFDTTLHAPDDTATVLSSMRLSWLGASAPFLIEADTDSGFGDPFTATTTDNSIALTDLRRGTEKLDIDTYFWRVTGTGFGLTSESTTRSFTTAPGYGEAGSPGVDCAQVRDRGDNPPTGLYWIDADGSGSRPNRQVYCEMDIDGGGWMLVFNLDTSDGNWQYYDVGFWSNTGSTGSAVNARIGDYRDADLFTNQGGSALMIQVHEEGVETAWRSWNLISTNSMRQYFNGGYNQTITSGIRDSGNIGDLVATEPMIQDAGQVIINNEYGGQDKERMSNSANGYSNNAGGGLGTYYDYGIPTCTRPCADAQMTGTSTWASGNIGTDIHPNSGWGTPSGQNYDYAIFIR